MVFRRGCTRLCRERRFDADFAANLPVEAGVSGWNGPADAVLAERSPAAPSQELPTHHLTVVMKTPQRPGVTPSLKCYR